MTYFLISHKFCTHFWSKICTITLCLKYKTWDCTDSIRVISTGRIIKYTIFEDNRQTEDGMGQLHMLTFRNICIILSQFCIIQQNHFKNKPQLTSYLVVRYWIRAFYCQKTVFFSFGLFSLRYWHLMCIYNISFMTDFLFSLS